MLCSTRDMAIFLAGAATLHMISHIAIAWFGMLPMHIPFFNIEWTSQYNMYAIIASAVVAAVLLWWSCKLK
jgi:hypothetical protein